MKRLTLFAFMLMQCCAAAVQPDAVAPISQRPRVTETDEAIVVRVGGKPVLRYHKADTTPPPGIEQVFARSGYIHPIRTPDGVMVTGHYPVDHPHQSGLFSAWVNTTFRGHRVDFWNKKKGLGSVSHDRVIATANHDDRAEFSVMLIHDDLSDPEQPVTVLRERWDVVVHANGETGYVIDLTSTQSCATADPLTINEYHYGGLALRGCPQWYNEATSAAAKQYEKKRKSDPDAVPPTLEDMRHRFLTSESKGRFDGNHSRPDWVDIHGSVNGKMAGIAVLSHHENFRSPQPVRLHPSKPYFCFSPCVTGSFVIKPGEGRVSKYRFLIHDGPPDPDQIEMERERFHRESISGRD